MRTAGLDIGSRTVKLVILEDGELVHSQVVDNSHDPLAVCDRLLSGRTWDRVVATGYGRHLFEEHRGGGSITEIRAVALAAAREAPGVGAVLDIGGQDTKVISLDERGRVLKFEMNDRCAAGTGRFLEVMATALSYTMEEFVQAGLTAETSRAVNAMCTVFAESEVISAMARGVPRAELARGLHEAVVRRVVSMESRVQGTGRILFCGGGARNSCLGHLLSRDLIRELVVPANPQIFAALGAALSCSG